MTSIRWYGPSLVLLVTVLLVMVAGPGVVRHIAWAQSDAHITLVKDELSHNPTLAELSIAFRKVSQVVEPSVVHVQIFGTQRNDFFGRALPHDENMDRYDAPGLIGSGSGWVYDNKGHIITNYHVVENAERIKVRFSDGSERNAKVAGTDPKTDVAVIEVEGDGLHPATLALEPVQQGDIVFAFGSPFRFEFSMSQGIVSAKGRQLGILRESQGYENFIQTDAAVNPGNSGGPLTNIYGQVVGMNTAIATRTGASNGLGFAIPVAMVKDVVDQIIQSGRVSRGYLGIYIKDLDPQMAQSFGYDGKGVLVDPGPIPGGPGEKAGIKRGDIILSVNDKAVTTAEELRTYVASLAPDTKTKLVIFRDGKKTDLDLTIGELPDSTVAVRPGRGRPGATQPAELGLDALRKLGIERVTDLTPALAQRLRTDVTDGAVVQEVRPSSVAAARGIVEGVIITDIQGVAVKNVAELAAEIVKYDLKKGVRMSVLREGDPHFVFLSLSQE